MNRSAIAIFTTFAVLVAACGGAAVPASPAPSASAAASAAIAAVGADTGLTELRIDYATYSPPSPSRTARLRHRAGTIREPAVTPAAASASAPSFVSIQTPF